MNVRLRQFEIYKKNIKMYAIVLLGFLALASAAPHYNHRHYDHFGRHHHSFEPELERYLEQNMFDTNRFWQDLRRDMMELDKMLADLSKHFPSSVSSEKIEGNEYIITIPLSGYEEKEITVKARKGLLVVQAVHKVDDVPTKNYLDVRTLPDCANEAGSWTFENGILKITFPLEKKESTDVAVTDAPQHSREELEPNASSGYNTDNVRGDIDVQTAVLNNEIPKRTPVEATTYAVDLKGEVELLPSQY